MLYQIASNAILDGYYREAVTSFAASLERFYEFSVRVLLRARGLEHAEIQEAWTAITDRSERQLGAFVAMWTAQFKTPPEVLSGKKQNFRNDVVHKGVIPTREKSLGFGQAVLDLIRAQRSILKSAHQREISEIVGRRNGDLMRSAGQGVQVSLTVTPSAVSISDASPPIETLAEIIEKMQQNREMFDKMIRTFKQHAERQGRPTILGEAIRKESNENGGNA
jgi:hypothetical protein